MKMQIPVTESQYFYIQAAARPLVDRAEGGHMYIIPKFQIRDRTQLTPAQAIEYTKLSMVVGEALKTAMARRGVDIGIVNYQDMGNWSVFKPEGPTMHMQIYGRATTATIQKYGEAVQLPQKTPAFTIILCRSTKTTLKRSKPISTSSSKAKNTAASGASNHVPPKAGGIIALMQTEIEVKFLDVYVDDIRTQLAKLLPQQCLRMS